MSALPQEVAGVPIADALVLVGHCVSLSEAKRLVRGGGAYINDESAWENAKAQFGDKISAGRRRHAFLPAKLPPPCRS